MTRTSAGAAFERIPLVAGSNPSLFEGMLFKLDKGTEYFVEANGVHSPTFTMSVLDLPTVGKLELEYHFPAYTGLPVQKVETRRRRGRAARHGSVDEGDADHAVARREDSGQRVGQRRADEAGRRHAHRQVHRQGRRLLQDPADGPARRAGGRVAEVHDRRPEGPAARRLVHQAGPRQLGEPRRRSLRRGEGQRRLRREAAADDLLGQRRRREDDQAVRRRQGPAGSLGGPHDLPRGAGREAGRLRVLLREGHRQQRRRGREDDDERHLLRERPAVPQGLQAGAVAGRRRRWWRRRRRRAAVGTAAADRRGDVQHGPRQAEAVAPRNTARTSCSSTSRRPSCARRWTSWSASSRRASASWIRASRPSPRRCRRRRPR